MSEPPRPPTALAFAGPPRLELRGITKSYPGVLAVDRVDLAVHPGEIHAVLGENGAGKTTLMKMIYGLVEPDAGTLLWHGRLVKIANPAHARRLGIGMVFQHFSLFETLTVAENITLALDRGRDRRALAQSIREISERYGLPLAPERRVHTMSVGERQRVEIVRCLLQRPELLILDEPTSVLTPQAVVKLFDTLRQLAADGCSILYISHKLAEIRTLCHRATVLRGGRVTGECDPRDENDSSLARMMIGDDLPHPRHRTARPSGAAALEVRGLSLASADPFGTSLHDVSLTVRGGEILGIAGISGNGQHELLAALAGERLAPTAEAVQLHGEPVGRLGVADRRTRGLASIPEDRLGRGAVPEMSLAENVLLTSRASLGRNGFIRRDAMRAAAAEIVTAYGVKAPGLDAAARSLSGGNLQKFIVGREIRHKPAVLLAAQPTWGVDVGASAMIRQSLLDLRDGGAAVIVVSEELDELFEVADAIAVLAQGRLSAATPARDTDAEHIGLLMGGTALADAADVTRAGASTRP